MSTTTPISSFPPCFTGLCSQCANFSGPGCAPGCTNSVNNPIPCVSLPTTLFVNNSTGIAAGLQSCQLDYDASTGFWYGWACNFSSFDIMKFGCDSFNPLLGGCRPFLEWNHGARGFGIPHINPMYACSALRNSSEGVTTVVCSPYVGNADLAVDITAAPPNLTPFQCPSLAGPLTCSLNYLPGTLSPLGGFALDALNGSYSLNQVGSLVWYGEGPQALTSPPGLFGINFGTVTVPVPGNHPADPPIGYFLNLCLQNAAGGSIENGCMATFTATSAEATCSPLTVTFSYRDPFTHFLYGTATITI